MSYLDTIQTIGTDAEKLEIAYQGASDAGEADAFTAAIDDSYSEQPDNLLYAAWYYRLAQSAVDKAKTWTAAWAWAIPLAVLNGLLFWWLSDDQQFTIQMTDYLGENDYTLMPSLALIWAPISAAFIMLYLALAGQRKWRWLALVVATLALISGYVLAVYPQAGPRIFQEQYLNLMIFHAALLAWAGIGIYLVAGLWDAENRFYFLIKSLEVFITAGIFIIAGGLFVSITIGLFDALGIHLSEIVMRLLMAGGAGVLPVLTVAFLYNPTVAPSEQPFNEGLSQLIAVLMRALLPLSLVVLVIYLAFIPTNFRQPFENRDVLIIYNAMLFAVMALLLGATPVREADISERMAMWLRRGIVAVATLAVLVGLYALSAMLYRTWQDKLTPNRLTFMGWNIINVGILVWLLVRQLVGERANWLKRLHASFATGAVVYVIWAIIVILAIPWMFSINQGNVEALPTSVQRIVYEEAYPILLKCSGSPHVYSLEKGEKRWIQDIPTFESEGFAWHDVRRVPCVDLRGIPDGMSIPQNAGPPPQP